MSPELVIQISQETLRVVVMLSAPLLLSALGVGLVIGLFQAATQIQEMTLSFIPKLMAVVAALFIAGAWMLQVLSDFTIRLYERIPYLLE
ncbi:MAG: flagellar biosynthetic protein FliQ [Candidatus Azotimanducaceae bacterium]|jgi:flagellar biosynthetic protein FliQ